jgi:HD-GYP domain-containing protein (c-di-GMP phosphodiesterase class II)
MLAIDMRDPATGIHCRIVGDLAGQIATSMGLSEDEVRLIILSGRLHDLGKLAIPDRILRNTDDLNDRQKEIIRTHAAHGERIVTEFAPLDVIVGHMAAIIGAHHEHWNGKGYPRGLRTTEIPLGARVIAVADTYSAIVAHRTYQVAMPVGHAIEVLLAGAGTQFDPDVVSFAMESLSTRVGEMPTIIPRTCATIEAIGRRQIARRSADRGKIGTFDDHDPYKVVGDSFLQ